MLRKQIQTSVKKDARASVRKKSVRADEDLCRALFESGDEAILLFDRVGRCLDINPSGCRLLGVSRRKLRNRLSMNTLFTLNGMEGSRQLQDLRRGQMKNYTARIRRNDGCEVMVDVRAKGLTQGRKLVLLRQQLVSLSVHERLQESERFLDSVLENLPNMVFIKDAANLQFIRFNKAGEELLGYSRDELLGKNDHDFFPKHEADFFTAKDREVLASGHMFDIAEEPIQTKTHGTRLLHTKKIPILTENGTPKYLLGLSEDITERYQLRVQEAERKHRLKVLAESTLMLSGDPAAVCDQTARLMGELFSVKVVCISEIVGSDLHFKSVYVDGQVFQDAGTCPLAVTPCSTVEMTRDVQVFDRVTERFPEASFLSDHQAVTYCGFPVLDSSGRVVAVICLLDDKPHEFTEEDQHLFRLFGQRVANEIQRAGDMAERQGIEDRLRTSEARLDFLLSSTPAVVYSARATGDYSMTFMSKNVRKVLGYSPNDFIADPSFWASRIHPDDRDRVFSTLPILFDQESFTHEYRLLHQNGTYHWMRDELRVVYDRDGQPAELVGCWYDITDRKSVEESLAASEKRFRHVVEHLPIGLISVDQGGAVTMVNAETENIFGYARNELIGQSIDLLVPHRYWSTHQPRREQFLRNPRTARLGIERHLPGLRKDGTEISLEIGLTPMSDPHGAQVLASVMDVTDRRQAEERLCENEAKYRRIVETAMEGIWQIDEHNRTTFVNRQMAEMLGYRVDEMMGHSLYEFMDEEAKLEAKAAVERRRQGVSEQHEFRFQRKDGASLWTSMSTNPFIDQAGRYTGALALVSDITQRKSDKVRIEAAERRLRNVMDSLLVFVGLFSSDSIFIDANRTALEAAGLKREDAIGKRYRDTYWGSDLPDACRIVEEAIISAARGEIVRAEVPVRVGPDRVLIMDAFFNPIHDGEGRVGLIIGSGIDITDRKQAEEELRGSERRLAEAQRIACLGYWSWDMLTDTLEWSEETKTILQYRPEMGIPTVDLFMRFVHPDDLALIRTNNETLLKTGSGPDMEYRIVRPDGDIRIVLAHVGGALDRDGRIIRAFGTIQDITDRKQSEDVLRTNEERLRLALRSARQGLYDLDLTTGKADVNDEYATMLGYDPDEFEETNTWWVERLHDDDRERVLAMYQAYIRGEVPSYEVEFRQRTKSGGWKWILSIGSIVSRDADGRPLRMLGTHLDITERKQAELALKRQEALLESFFSQSLDGCFFMMLDEPVEWNAVVDKDQVLEQIFSSQRLTRVNDAMLLQYGADREKFVGLTPNDLFANNRQYWKEVWRLLLDRERLVIQTTEQKLDGTPMWIEGEYVCLYDEQGRFIGHFGVQREVTTQKRMEEDLRSNGARLSEAQRLAKLGNWELDLRSHELIWSDEIYRIFEIDHARFGASYETFLSAVHPDDRMLVDDAYTTSVAERKPYSLIHRLLMPDGRVKYVQEHGETDYDERLQPIRSRGTVQDVTDRRLAELRIEASLHEKETLLREVHHRVKNNLQIISSLLYFQSKKIRDPHDLSAFQEGQDRLKSMILVHEKLYRSDDLMRIEFADYVRALTDGICQSYMSVSTKVKLDIDMPAITLPVEIAMPAGMIVNELLSNVFKYAFPEGRGGSVWIRATKSDRGIEILVVDSGAGLPEGINPERPTTFGMQLIHGLTAQLDGRIWFDRQGGTSVRVFVPLPVSA